MTNKQTDRDLLAAIIAVDQAIRDGQPDKPVVIAYETLTIAGTALTLVASFTGDAESFVGVLETGQVRKRAGGTPPTASEGTLVEIGGIVALSADEIVNMQFIRTGATSGVLKGHYYNVPVSAVLGAIEGSGATFVQGPAASGDPAVGGPLRLGADVDNTTPLVGGEGDIRALRTSPQGRLLITSVSGGTLGDNAEGRYTVNQVDDDRVGPVIVMGKAPDGGHDRNAMAMDSGPGLGAQNVAPIGGNITLRASAVIGEASGTSTAVDNLGWVKGFNAHLDVTQTRTGGSSNAKLDVFLQTQLASGDWQDIVHWTQVGVSVTSEIVDWGPVAANFSGVGADSGAIAVDRFFPQQDVAMAATNLRVMNLGDSMRTKHVYTAGDSDASDYIFEVKITAHS